MNLLSLLRFIIDQLDMHRVNRLHNNMQTISALGMNQLNLSALVTYPVLSVVIIFINDDQGFS